MGEIAQTVLGCFGAVAVLGMCLGFVWDKIVDCFTDVPERGNNDYD